MTAPRRVGRRLGARPGPTLLVVGGIHGNEPAGVDAAARVLARLEADRVELAGDFVALRGNLRSLGLGRRYQDRDLNRMWAAAALAAPPGSTIEDRERAELKAAIDQVIAEARGPVTFVDLHTTSADGFPFAMTGDTLRGRAFAAAIPLPILLGLEELLDGVLPEYVSSRGAVTLGVEGGQHASPRSAHNLEAVLWVALAAAGLAAPSRLAAYDEAHAHLRRARGDLPKLIEVLSRHHVDGDDGFRMEPGFANVGRVRARQLLARDRRGEIRAPRDGMLLLPLYQQGDDGFFLGREIPPWEERATAATRSWGGLLGYLPGVRGAPEGDRLDVARPLAALYPTALWRWFGYRRMASGASGLALERRRA